MQNDAATLQCPNDLCKAPNSQTDKFCQQCGTPLIKRYLWAVGERISAYKLGDLVAERYLLKRNRIFLDTKPGLSPQTPDLEISDAIKPYLRLAPYRLQVPQMYGLIPALEGEIATEILLLEQAPIYTDVVPLEGQLMPELTSAWKDASSMRQLNWLWQMAQLWQPLSTEGVASSLLNPRLLRVEGSLVRLLELRLDGTCTPTLPKLGQLWSQLAAGVRPSISKFLEQLCLSLEQREVQTAEQLVAVLDRVLAEVGRSQARTLSIATCTDTGPSRQRNEDACYPPSGNTIIKPPDPKALAIICDGIGGHEGGNVASNLAIETLQQQVQQIPLDDTHLDATILIDELESSACAANDRISQRNDNEYRQGRQRMGTTLVMALAHAHEIYITHVGDSRAYWITPTGCHQVTLDDDVASREVRLGYAFYRDALQQISSGSLVQALGMSSSLHPTVQRFVLDANCVFLLCSDGLSDYELVDQCWKTEILPILDGKVDVATASQRLVEIANTQNGHDNVTVGLVYCQVNSSEPKSKVSPSLVQQITVSPGFAYPDTRTTVVDTNNPNSSSNASPSTLQTQLLPSQPAPRRFFVPVLLGIILLLCLGGLAYLFIPAVSSLVNPLISSNPSLNPSPTANSSPSVSPLPNSSIPLLEAGSLIQIKSLTTGSAQGSTLRLFLRRGIKPPQNQLTIGFIPASALVQVTAEPTTLENDTWLPLRVCSTSDSINSDAALADQAGKSVKPSSSQVQESPPSASVTDEPVQPGKEGWIRQAEIEPFISSTSKPAQQGKCQTQTRSK